MEMTWEVVPRWEEVQPGLPSTPIQYQSLTGIIAVSCQFQAVKEHTPHGALARGKVQADPPYGKVCISCRRSQYDARHAVLQTQW